MLRSRTARSLKNEVTPFSAPRRTFSRRDAVFMVAIRGSFPAFLGTVSASRSRPGAGPRSRKADVPRPEIDREDLVPQEVQSQEPIDGRSGGESMGQHRETDAM